MNNLKVGDKYYPYYKPGLRVPDEGAALLLKEYNEAKLNGICECKTPLSLFTIYGNEYCKRCSKIVKDE